MQVEELFHQAIELSPQERDAFLNAACGDNAELRARVAELLEAHDHPGSFLQAPAGAACSPTVSDAPLTEAPGTVIGPYRLVEQIGEGGFGVVFMAEQTAPVKRKVALKVIKPGMDTREVIARFEAERQALALMDHPNIAKVLDAGATETGRPFFVMELVRGVPVTEYCDQAQLTPRQRLDLFVTVCHAVQHAHQKGIIHRDIKPTNVLVAQHDDRPVVKVIDFGVAKAVSGQLTDKTLFTGFAQVVGTPLYMSPEQAALSAIDIDTRSDIYSLGVLLYELLTGTTPFDKVRLQQAAFEEVRRIIREEEPQKPSTRLSSLGATLPSVSAVRRTEPRKLSQLVRGDLDWIVMKALEKDRARRYDSANGFAADVLRYLADEPVEACPPSAAYRFRKFARRNKKMIAAGTVVASSLIVVTVGLAVSNVLVRAERNEKIQALADRETALREKTAALSEREDALRQARENLAEARRQEKLANENLARAEAGFANARRAVDEFLTKVTDSQLLEAPGLQPLRRDLLQSALAFYEEFLKERGDDPQLRAALAAVQYRVSRIYAELGDGRSWAAVLEAKSLYETFLKEAPADAEALAGLARCHRSLFEHEEAIAILTELQQSDPANRQYRSELADAYNSLALSFQDSEPDKCLDWHRKALELRQALVDESPDDPDARRDLGGSLGNIGNVLLQQGHAQDALTMFQRAVEQQRAAFDRDPQGANNARYLLIGTQNVGTTYWRMGDLEAAEQWHRKWIDLAEQVAADNSAVPYFQASLWNAYRWLSALLRFQGRFTEADASGQRAIAVLERFPDKTPEDLYQLACLRSQIVGGFDERGPELTSEEAAERDEMAAAAVADLQAAVQGVAGEWNRFLTDQNLEAIRDRADFRELVARLRTAEENAARLAAAKQADDEDRMGRETLRAQQELVEQNPGNPKFRDELAATKHAIGLGLIETPRRDEAETLLREALAMREALVAEARANVRYGLNLGQTNLVLGELHWSASRFAEADAEFQQALSTMESALQKEPSDSGLWGELDQARTEIAIRFLNAGLWEESADLFAQASRRDASVLFPSQGHYWHVHAVLRLFVGDEAGFRDVCAAFHRKFKFADERFNLYRTAFAGADALPRGALLELTAAADRDVSRAAETGWYRLFPMMLNERLGEHALALEQLDAIPPGSAGIDLEPIRALVLHHLGRMDEARAALDAADELSDRRFRADLDQPAQRKPDPYPEVRLLFEVLRREAHAEIDGRQDVDSPYRLLARARLLAAMGRTATADEAIAAALALRSNDAQVHVALGRLFQELDRLAEADAHWEQAEKLLEESLAQNSDDPSLLRATGQLHAWRGDWERAASAYDTLLDLLSVPDRRIDGLENRQVVHEISASNQLFDQLVRLRPYDWRLWEGGAEFQALSGQWLRAAEIAQMWTHSNPGDNMAWFLDGILQLYLENIDGYRSSCRELLERFAEGAEPYIAERIVKTCCLTTDENVDLHRLMDVATRAADEAEGANVRRSCQVARGMLEYRSGRYQPALDSLNDVLAQSQRDGWMGWCEGRAALFQAMALHSLGRFDEATQALEQARQLVAELYPEWTPGQVGINWKECVCYQIALREAETLLQVEPTNPVTTANPDYPPDG